MLSKNSRKLLYGNNQQICLWDVEKAEIEMMTKQWKNINCYALNDEGTQFALGTYSGSIFVLTIIGPQRVTEF
jgi:WD40 repeat protein